MADKDNTITNNNMNIWSSIRQYRKNLGNSKHSFGSLNGLQMQSTTSTTNLNNSGYATTRYYTEGIQGTNNEHGLINAKIKNSIAKISIIEPVQDDIDNIQHNTQNSQDENDISLPRLNGLNVVNSGNNGITSLTCFLESNRQSHESNYDGSIMDTKAFIDHKQNIDIMDYKKKCINQQEEQVDFGILNESHNNDQDDGIQTCNSRKNSLNRISPNNNNNTDDDDALSIANKNNDSNGSIEYYTNTNMDETKADRENHLRLIYDNTIEKSLDDNENGLYYCDTTSKLEIKYLNEELYKMKDIINQKDKALKELYLEKKKLEDELKEMKNLLIQNKKETNKKLNDIKDEYDVKLEELKNHHSTDILELKSQLEIELQKKEEDNNMLYQILETYKNSKYFHIDDNNTSISLNSINIKGPIPTPTPISASLNLLNTTTTTTITTAPTPTNNNNNNANNNNYFINNNHPNTMMINVHNGHNTQNSLNIHNSINAHNGLNTHTNTTTNNNNNLAISEYENIIHKMKEEFINELSNIHKIYQAKIDHYIQEKIKFEIQIEEYQQDIQNLLLKLRSQPGSLQNTAIKTARFMNENSIGKNYNTNNHHQCISSSSNSSSPITPITNTTTTALQDVTNYCQPFTVNNVGVIQNYNYGKQYIQYAHGNNNGQQQQQHHQNQGYLQQQQQQNNIIIDDKQNKKSNDNMAGINKILQQINKLMNENKPPSKELLGSSKIDNIKDNMIASSYKEPQKKCGKKFKIPALNLHYIKDSSDRMDIQLPKKIKIDALDSKFYKNILEECEKTYKSEYDHDDNNCIYEEDDSNSNSACFDQDNTYSMNNTVKDLHSRLKLHTNISILSNHNI